MARVEAVEFASGVPGLKAPVDGGCHGVALGYVGIHHPLQVFRVGIASKQAGPGRHAELHLRHIQPTAVLKREVKVQPLGDASCLHRRKGLVQGRRPARIAAWPGVPCAPTRQM